ncbi:hypothetical protein ACS0TY_006853 [Phlomoides rotata]
MSHMVPIKLTTTNYLLWHTQVYPLLATKKLLPYVDGSFPPSPSNIVDAEVSKINPAYAFWLSRDQIVRFFLMRPILPKAPWLWWLTAPPLS